jgi:hypothetical protein
MHQRAGDRPPPLCVIGADHDQVDRNAHRAQRFPQSHELGAPAFQLWLDYQQVEVRPRLSLSSGMGAEENDPRIGGSLGQATTGLGD